MLGLTLVLGVLGAVLADVAPTFVSGAGGLADELAEPPAGGWADVEAAGGMSGMSTLVLGTLGPVPYTAAWRPMPLAPAANRLALLVHAKMQEMAHTTSYRICSLIEAWHAACCLQSISSQIKCCPCLMGILHESWRSTWVHC